MSLRQLKINLHKKNPYCYYCGGLTVLTNISGGRLPANAATIEHIISRYNPMRWVNKKKNERRKVLACSGCNHKRSVQETLCLSRADILKRSHGFSLSPKGKPRFIKPLPTINDVLVKLDIIK